MLTDQARAAVARGWASSCLTQAQFAADHGIAPRTLRLWVERFGDGERPVERAKAIIDTAFADLKKVRETLDAEAAREAATPPAPEPLEREEAPTRKPMPPPGFFAWG